MSRATATAAGSTARPSGRVRVVSTGEIGLEEPGGPMSEAWLRRLHADARDADSDRDEDVPAPDASDLDSATPGSEEPILVVDHLVKHFPIKAGILFDRQIGAVRAVDDVSFTVKRGETLGLVGESGCGKSTLARSILQLIEPTSGSVRFEGQEITGLRRKDSRALRAQHADRLPGPVRLAEPAQADRAGSSATRCGCTGSSPATRSTTSFASCSSGSASTPSTTTASRTSSRAGSASGSGSPGRSRCDPKLIIADEPVSALDVSIQAQIINLLEDLQEEFDLTYVFVAHDLGVVRHVADRIAVMYLGKIVEIGAADEVYANPIHPYTQSLLSAVPIPDPRANAARKHIVLEGDVPSPANPPPACRFHTRCPYATEVCSTEEPPLIDHGGGHFAACHHPLDARGRRADGRGAHRVEPLRGPLRVRRRMSGRPGPLTESR